MELFSRFLGKLLVFEYHCFDRIVINGHLSGLTHPENMVYFFRVVHGIHAITKEIMTKIIRDYQRCIGVYASNKGIPIEWAVKGVLEIDYVQPWLHKMD